MSNEKEQVKATEQPAATAPAEEPKKTKAAEQAKEPPKEPSKEPAPPPQAPKKEFSTALDKISGAYGSMIERQMETAGIRFDQYARSCVLNAIGAINSAMKTAGVEWADPQLDQSNVTQILYTVASLRLNAAAQPREIYFQIRKIKPKKEEDEWRKVIEMGIEGDGNDALLANFGRNVKKVCPFWPVREGDIFEYPKYKGIELTAPKWEPTGNGKVIRIVYPIISNDNTVNFYIAERGDVIKNLIAHVNNNIMNETFGIAPDRFKASAEQKKAIGAKKEELLEKVKNLGLDALDEPELSDFISPAWREGHSREDMIIRKMRNNIVKKIPKDFGHTMVEEIYNEATDDTYRTMKQEVAENANGVVIDVTPTTDGQAKSKAVTPDF